MARTTALRSLCSRDKVGACVVSASNRLLDTGYNGPPRGFARERLSARNLDGTLIVDDESCVLWCPRALRASRPIDEKFEWNNQMVHMVAEQRLRDDYSDCPSVHAEVNALLFGDRTQREGGTLYVSSGVCFPCAKLVANSGVVRVVVDLSKTPEHRLGRDANQFMVDCGLDVLTILNRPIDEVLPK